MPPLVASSVLVLAIACFGRNLLLDYTSLLSRGHAVYFGVGAHAGASLFTFGDMMSCAAGVLSADNAERPSSLTGTARWMRR